MASSTSRPIESSRASSVSRLIEKPSAWRTAKVPTRETGIATTVMAVVVGEWRKNRFTSTTIANTIASVFETSRSASRTKIVKSTARPSSTPSGSARWTSGSFASTARETASSFARDCRTIPTPTTSLRVKRVISW
jgi:hypothetical protein